jgi:predicted aspartyl protease
MPSQAVALDPDLGALIEVAIAPPGTLAAGRPLHSPAWVHFSSLIDTGANTTCIKPMVARRVGLASSGEAEMVSGTQTATARTFLADLIVPLGLEKGFANPQLARDLRLTEFVGEMETDILLGLDVLQNLTIHFDGPGRQVTVSAT